MSNYRGKGQGSVTPHGGGYAAYAPGTRTSRKYLGTFPSRYVARKALETYMAKQEQFTGMAGLMGQREGGAE